MKVDTIEQFKVLQWLKQQNIDLEEFEVFLIDRYTLKLVDKVGDYLFFKFEDGKVKEYEKI